MKKLFQMFITYNLFYINNLQLNMIKFINLNIHFFDFYNYDINKKLILMYCFHIKNRISYLLNNWFYSTNHKRISINYFWFTLLAGVCGLVLATLIRAEMAYPGVSILAGDSLQYLSIVTAHGVVMVFFMVIPLIFGFYSNFLLPTQLGVHDVAFPRLNSAAFWFLPAGLIMLTQLISIDRRYQRMNLFNIREAESILKKKFHFDLFLNKKQNIFLNKTLINYKYTLNNLESYKNNNFLYFKYNFNITNKNYIINFKLINNKLITKSFLIKDWFVTPFNLFTSTLITIINLFQLTFTIINQLIFNFYNLLFVNFWLLIFYLLNLIYFINLQIIYIFYNINFFFKFLFDFLITFNNLSIYWNITFLHKLNLTYFYSNWFKTIIILLISKINDFYLIFFFHKFLWNFINNLFLLPYYLLTFININLLISFFTFQFNFYLDFLNNIIFFNFNYLNFYYFNNMKIFVNPLNIFFFQDLINNKQINKKNKFNILYNFKTGNYFSDEFQLKYTYMLNTFDFITRNKNKNIWFKSNTFFIDFKINFFFFFNKFNKFFEKNFFFNNLTYLYQKNFFLHTDIFYYIFLMIINDNYFFNKNWINYYSLEKKFRNFFLNENFQFKILNNWRNLKFHREGWRCKLLSIRNQNSFYKRHNNEKNLFWTIERNAKDVLPGWAMITPFSARFKFTIIGKVDIGLFVVLLTIIASMVSSINFLITYRYLSTLNNRKMRDAKSFFTEAVLISSWMMIFANPMLALSIIMLISDRHWKTSFFDYSGGGDTVLFQHMFWFFGHPEVYIIMIPCFGFTNTFLSYYLRKRISARASLLYSMYTIAFLGFFVWGHHMYMVGLSHTTRMLYSTLTVMISIPAATKIMHWMVTFINGSLHFELPIMFTLWFIFSFISGGISGMAVAHTGMDILFHDTFFVVGHFHVMFSGSVMFAAFAAFYFYLPSLFTIKYNTLLAYMHSFYFIIGQFMTFVPMIWLGYAGMPRRVLDYPLALGGWHSFISAGNLLAISGIFLFVIMLFESIRKGKCSFNNTYGIGRYNTRLNFYLYEISKLIFIRRKSMYLIHTDTFNVFQKMNKLKTKFWNLEVTYIEYHFIKFLNF